MRNGRTAIAGVLIAVGLTACSASDPIPPAPSPVTLPPVLPSPIVAFPSDTIAKAKDCMTLIGDGFLALVDGAIELGPVEEICDEAGALLDRDRATVSLADAVTEAGHIISEELRALSAINESAAIHGGTGAIAREPQHLTNAERLRRILYGVTP